MGELPKQNLIVTLMRERIDAGVLNRERECDGVDILRDSIHFVGIPINP
jgi:hypothetical protein